MCKPDDHDGRCETCERGDTFVRFPHHPNPPVLGRDGGEKEQQR